MKRILFFLLMYHTVESFGQSLPIFNQKSTQSSKKSNEIKSSSTKSTLSSVVPMAKATNQVVYRLMSDVETYLFEGSKQTIFDSIKPGVPLKIVMEKGSLYHLRFVAKIENEASYGDILIIDDSDKGRDYHIRLQPVIDSIVNRRKIEIDKQKYLLDSLNAANKRANEISFSYRFFDHFDDNAQKWETTSEGPSLIRNITDKKEMYIKDGTFNLVGINDEYVYNSKRSFSGLDLKKNFEIIVLSKWIQDKVNQTSGIIWCGQDNENYFVFGITADGSYKISQLKNNNWIAITKYTSSKLIVERGANKLRISKKGENLFFYINDSIDPVFNMPFNKDMSNYFGIFVSGNQFIKFDDFEVKGYILE